MIEILTENNEWVFYDYYEKRRKLLDFNDYMSNKSNRPFCENDIKKRTTIAEFLDKMIYSRADIKQLTEKESNKNLDYLLYDLVLTKIFTGFAGDVKIAEIGCDDGVLSWHTSMITGFFNEKSRFYMIGENTDEAEGMVMIAEYKPEISLYRTSLDKTEIKDKCFDIVIINGTVKSDSFYSIVKEAERITKKDGILLCFPNDNILLEECFKLIFEKREDYVILPARGVFCVKNTEEGWSNSREKLFSDMILDLNNEIKEFMQKKYDKEKLRELIKKADKCTDMAIKEKNTEMKIKLIDLKSCLTDCIFDMEKHRGKLKEKLIN